MRVLYIARYHDAVTERKIALMAAQPDLSIRLVRPRWWQDEFGRTELPVAGGQGYGTTAVPLMGRPADPHRAIYRTWTFGMRSFAPDIIHAEEEPDSLAALHIALARAVWAPKARLVLYTWQNVNRPKRWHVKAILRATLKAADHVLCANREAVSVLRQLGYRRSITVMPAIGVDTLVFRPCPPERANKDAFVVGYIGRLVPEKGIDVLIDALSQLGEGARLRIVGDGPYRQALEEMARATGVGARVDWVPPVRPAQIAQQLCLLDALVLPSRTTPVWKEQFGRVLTEAMACKVPVVGSDSGAIPEVIGDAGQVFPEGDAAGLTACLRRLMDAPDLRRDLAERGYARVQQHYTQERIAEQTVAFYRCMLQTGA